ncbi:MAG: hypothetical protein LWX70_14765, partial [Sphingobacteriia bacterium]|nr:hypothetical protein [Sphingobacteriia bacterium]
LILASCESSVNSNNPRSSYTLAYDSIRYGEDSSVRRDDSVFIDYSKTKCIILQYEYKSTNPLSIEYWARNKNNGPNVFQTAYDHGETSNFLFVSDTIYPQLNATSNIFSITYNLKSPVFPGSLTIIRNLNLYKFD